MKTRVHLIMDKRGSVRTTKRRPDLHAGEVAVLLRIEVDDRHFRMPFAEADLVLGAEQLIQPDVDIEVESPVADSGGQG